MTTATRGHRSRAKLQIQPGHVEALERLATAHKRNPHAVGQWDAAQDALDDLLNSLCQAIDRPGSWERGAFETIFGLDFDYIETDH